MLKGNVVVLQYLQHLSAKADFAVHHILFDGNDRKALFPGDTGNDTVCVILPAFGNDHGPGRFRLVGIADIDRNSGIAHREDRFLMEHGSAHVGKLPKLPVSNRLNRAGVLYDPGVRHQKA